MDVLDDPSNDMASWGGKEASVACSKGSICDRSKLPEVLVGGMVSLTELLNGAGR